MQLEILFIPNFLNEHYGIISFDNIILHAPMGTECVKMRRFII